jgi:CRP-like cAMP-binding protein
VARRLRPRRAARGIDRLTGTWFGELAVLLHSTSAEVKSSVEALTRTDSRVLALKLAAYEELVDRSPDHYRLFARLALERYGMCLRPRQIRACSTPTSGSRRGSRLSPT